MEQELKACPFCGSDAVHNQPIRGIVDCDLGVVCSNKHCPTNSIVSTTDKDWNTRPLEIALQSELDTLKKHYLSAVATIYEKQCELDKVIDAERKKSLLADERGVELGTLKQSVKDAVDEIVNMRVISSGRCAPVAEKIFDRIGDILTSHGLIGKE